MKEYCIYCIWNGGKPFIQGTYKTLDSAKLSLATMISLEEERGRLYYVDNDFFENKHSYVGRLKYFCIKERNITEWEKCSKDKNDIENNNKIIYITNYKKAIDK